MNKANTITVDVGEDTVHWRAYKAIYKHFI